MRPPRKRPRLLAIAAGRRLAWPCLVAPCLVAALALGVLSPLTAGAQTPIETAKRRAAVLQGAVAATRLQAEVATEEYDRASDELAQAVSAELAGQEALTAAGDLAAGRGAQYEARVRAMYMSGGRMSLVTSVLRAQNLGDAIDRYVSASSVVSADRATASNSDIAAAQVAAAADRLGRLSDRKLAAQRHADEASARVENALATQEQLLANADEQVRVIAEQNAAAEQLAQELAFAAALRQAQLAATDVLAQSNVPAPTPQAGIAIEAAKTQLGKPYVWGATGPDSFDCSGLTGWAYRQAGVLLPRVSQDQWNAGPHPDLGHLLPGDLVFWATDTANPRTIHHVGIYIGNGLMIAAPYTGTVVRVQSMHANGYLGAMRPTQAAVDRAAVSVLPAP